MRIVYDYQIFSAQEYGGISRYYYELASRIAKYEGCEVSVHAPLYVNRYIKSNDKLKVIGIHVPIVPRTGRIRILLNDMLGAMLTRKYSPDIVHETYYFKHGTVSAKSKTVITVYDMINELFPDKMPFNDNTSKLKRLCCEKADKIIAISQSTMDDLVRLFGIKSEKIVVIHLGNSLNKNTLFQHHKICSGPYLLFVGVRRGYKNFDNLVTAFALSKSLKSYFHLVSFGGGIFSESEKTMFKDLGVNNIIHHIGGNDEVLSNCYRNATAFIYPSLYEGFGIPILEAMGFSCPVICSNTGSIPEVAGAAAAYFDPTNPDSIRQTLEDALFNERLLDDLRHRGIIRESEFSWDRCAKETLEVYRSLLN